MESCGNQRKVVGHAPSEYFSLKGEGGRALIPRNYSSLCAIERLIRELSTGFLVGRLGRQWQRDRTKGRLVKVVGQWSQPTAVSWVMVAERRILFYFVVILGVTLLNGNAEIFGTELAPEIWLNFPPRLKFAVFTWYGATIEMEGTTETDYTADETPMVSYVNVHAILEARRTRAKASSSGDSESSQGPRVIVVGPTNSGKSTLSRMLLSWVAKQGSKPTFVKLDIGQGSITILGCLAAT
ncbi:uncharacterized protein DS421_16g550470 [Arachis hypogaea]|nr:uncharacterized protein DS421_16g550470 [Arachis hypogaea]